MWGNIPCIRNLNLDEHRIDYFDANSGQAFTINRMA